jgi:hypothetical protein
VLAEEFDLRGKDSTRLDSGGQIARIGTNTGGAEYHCAACVAGETFSRLNAAFEFNPGGCEFACRISELVECFHIADGDGRTHFRFDKFPRYGYIGHAEAEEDYIFVAEFFPKKTV